MMRTRLVKGCVPFIDDLLRRKASPTLIGNGHRLKIIERVGDVLELEDGWRLTNPRDPPPGFEIAWQPRIRSVWE